MGDGKKDLGSAAGAAPNPPTQSAPTFRTIGGNTIFWREGNTVHACEGCYVSPPVDRTRLIWTLCEKDVPANAAYTTDAPEFVTCDACAKAESAALTKATA